MNPTKEDMATKKTKTATSASPKVMDITKPGALKTGTAGARPVIVSNRPLIQDPMVKTDTDGTEKTESAAPPSAPARSKIVIKPLSDPDTDVDMPETKPSNADELTEANKEGLLDIHFDADADAVEEGEAKPETAESRAAETDGKDEPTAKAAAKPEPAKEDESEKPAETDKADAVPAGITNSPADENADAKPESEASDAAKKTVQQEAEAKAQDELDELTENKTYFLPINASRQRRNLIITLVCAVLFVLLALVWLDVALDANFIEIPGVHPLTNLFG
jgi:hypothetical protein